MFEEFDRGNNRKSQRQLGLSLAVSAVVYLGALGTVVAASAAYHVVAKKEDLLKVEFRQPPKAEPPKPPPPPPEQVKPKTTQKQVEPARAKVIREELKAPDEIPDAKPAEADGPLPDAPTGDPGEGFLDGVVGGTGTAPSVGEVAPAPPPPPPPPAQKASAPVPLATNQLPEYPRAARRAGVVGTVKVRIWVSAEGVVTKLEILEGDPIFHSAVQETLMTWRYEPARLPDGTAVAVRRVIHIPFTLQ